LPRSIIKKGRIAQLIYEKLSENQNTHNNSQSIKPHAHTPGKHHHTANTMRRIRRTSLQGKGQRKNHKNDLHPEDKPRPKIKQP
jgi:hypothetical protein